MPWLDDREVQPDEIVDVPEHLVENFEAAGWRAPDQPVVWPPEPLTPPETPASGQVADHNPPADPPASDPVVVELPPDSADNPPASEPPADQEETGGKPAPTSSSATNKRAR